MAKIDRRDFLKIVSLASASLSLPLDLSAATAIPKRKIPKTGEAIPVIGLGTSDEFNYIPREGSDALKAVLATLVEFGGTLVDTSPIYGDAENVLGQLIAALELQNSMFIATKVNAHGKRSGFRQLQLSEQLLGKRPLDLIQVHSLQDLETQWDNLREWKVAGRTRYIGATVSREYAYYELEDFLRKESDIDFVQLNYSLMELRSAERLIPLAADKGVAIIVNRAFGNGRYFSRVRGRQLPEWSKEFDCESWAQFSLKFILANKDITCVIPASSNPKHTRDNLRAGLGRLPTKEHQKKMIEVMNSL